MFPNPAGLVSAPPDVCVVMCTFNGAIHLPEQLESILAQTHLPDRMVAVDDASSDASYEILRRFAERAPFPVEVLANEQTVGFRRNFERAIRSADGDVLVLCDQDDFWLPTRLERTIQSFADSVVSLVFTDAEVVGSGLNPLGFGLWDSVGLNSRRLSMIRNGRALELLTRGYWITGATMAFRGRWKDLVVPMDDVLVHDAWIALLLAAVGRVVAIPERLVLYRQHDRNEIGARHKANPAERAAHARATGRESLHTIKSGLLGAHRRLEERSALTRTAHAIFSDAVDHLDVRTSLPAGRLQRLPGIWRELARGRYAQRANGLSSALRDLMV